MLAGELATAQKEIAAEQSTQNRFLAAGARLFRAPDRQPPRLAWLKRSSTRQSLNFAQTRLSP